MVVGVVVAVIAGVAVAAVVVAADVTAVVGVGVAVVAADVAAVVGYGGWKGCKPAGEKPLVLCYCCDCCSVFSRWYCNGNTVLEMVLG